MRRRTAPARSQTSTAFWASPAAIFALAQILSQPRGQLVCGTGQGRVVLPGGGRFSIRKNHRSSAPNALRRQRSSMTMAAMFTMADSEHAIASTHGRDVPRSDILHCAAKAA
jgi:hypothetical protein